MDALWHRGGPSAHRYPLYLLEVVNLQGVVPTPTHLADYSHNTSSQCSFPPSNSPRAGQQAKSQQATTRLEMSGCSPTSYPASFPKEGNSWAPFPHLQGRKLFEHLSSFLHEERERKPLKHSNFPVSHLLISVSLVKVINPVFPSHVGTNQKSLAKN